MKRFFHFLMAVIMILSLFSSTSIAAGYTLPQRMYRQLKAGSGLMGSFVIHGNADPEQRPFLSLLQNAEYEIAGIKTDDYLHYHLFQPAENNDISIPAEFFRLNGGYYFGSTFTDNDSYKLPETDSLISLLTNTAESNPPVSARLLRILLTTGEGHPSGDTVAIEKMIDMWLSGYTPETVIQKDSGSVPQLTETFTIPFENLYETIGTVINYINQNDSALSVLRSSLSEDEISLYFNPDLLYYYNEAMNSLDIKGDIVFSRTVSTFGEMLESTLTLPLVEKQTGYSSLTIHSDDQRKRFELTGDKGCVIADLPVSLSFSEKEFEYTVHLILIRSKTTAEKNRSLRILLRKSHEEHSDPEETVTYETDLIDMLAEQDVSILPETVSPDLIAQTPPVSAHVELSYSSKSQVYSAPTTLKFSAAIEQGGFSYSIAGSVKTTSPDKIKKDYDWAFLPFPREGTADTGSYTLADFADLFSSWKKAAEEKIVHIPEDIRQQVNE